MNDEDLIQSLSARRASETDDGPPRRHPLRQRPGLRGQQGRGGRRLAVPRLRAGVSTLVGARHPAADRPSGRVLGVDIGRVGYGIAAEGPHGDQRGAGREHYKIYSAFYPVIRKVLKMRIWGILPAGGL